jgi:transposase-like protein
MKANIRKIKKTRRYTEAFKKSIVSSFEKGEHSVYEIERIYGIPNRTIYNWIYKYSTFNEKGYRVIEHKMSSTAKIKELEEKIKKLEQKVGQKQITIDYLETMMEVAKEELNIDIKKNFDTPPSGKSGKDGKK